MDIFYLVSGLVLLFACGSWLVTGSVQVARHLRISSLVIGLTVVAFGTSAPELFVSLNAALKGAPDISIGNVVGSNISNVGVVLGLVAMIFPITITSRGIWKDWLVMLLASLLLVGFSFDLELGFLEGAILVTGLVAYLTWTVRANKKGQSNVVVNPPTMSISKASGIVVLSITGLYFGSELLIDGARSIALKIGLSERVVGVTIVAFGTSVPELITSLMAALKKENEISIGNIIGSNIFNVLAILGVTSMVHPISVNPAILHSDYFWMIGFSVLLMLVMLPLKRGVVNRYEALLLVGLYSLYVYLLF